VPSNTQHVIASSSEKK